MRQFSTGATRDDADTKPDYRGFLSPIVLRRFGEYMTEHRKQADGLLRDSDNWKKGIPQKEYLSSLLRHVVDLHAMLEEPDPSPKPIEDLLSAILFNAQGLLHERLLGRDVIQEPVPTLDEWVRSRDILCFNYRDRGTCILCQIDYNRFVSQGVQK